MTNPITPKSKIPESLISRKLTKKYISYFQDNYNVLHIASMFSREDVVKLLLNKRGVDPYATGGVSTTTILYISIQQRKTFPFSSHRIHSLLLNMHVCALNLIKESQGLFLAFVWLSRKGQVTDCTLN